MTNFYPTREIFKKIESHHKKYLTLPEYEIKTINNFNEVNDEKKYLKIKIFKKLTSNFLYFYFEKKGLFKIKGIEWTWDPKSKKIVGQDEFRFLNLTDYVFKKKFKNNELRHIDGNHLNVLESNIDDFSHIRNSPPLDKVDLPPGVKYKSNKNKIIIKEITPKSYPKKLISYDIDFYGERYSLYLALHFQLKLLLKDETTLKKIVNIKKLNETLEKNSFSTISNHFTISDGLKTLQGIDVNPWLFLYENKYSYLINYEDNLFRGTKETTLDVISNTFDFITYVNPPEKCNELAQLLRYELISLSKNFIKTHNLELKK